MFFYSCALLFLLRQKNADLTFGGITIVCGIFGTIAGGCILDRMTSTISNAFKVFLLIMLNCCSCHISIEIMLRCRNCILLFAASFCSNLFWGNILLCCLLFQESICFHCSFLNRRAASFCYSGELLLP